jgi:flagellar biosynthesis GTPase FlhF
MLCKEHNWKMKYILHEWNDFECQQMKSTKVDETTFLGQLKQEVSAAAVSAAKK